MSLCIICGTREDVKLCTSAGFYGAPTLQDKMACGPCFAKAIEGKKQDMTFLTEQQKLERDERLRQRNQR